MTDITERGELLRIGVAEVPSLSAWAVFLEYEHGTELCEHGGPHRTEEQAYVCAERIWTANFGDSVGEWEQEP